MNNIVYGVFTQYEPTHKYDEALESIWTTKEAAEAEAKKDTTHDHVSVRKIYLNSHSYWMPDEMLQENAELTDKFDKAKDAFATYSTELEMANDKLCSRIQELEKENEFLNVKYEGMVAKWHQANGIEIDPLKAKCQKLKDAIDGVYKRCINERYTTTEIAIFLSQALVEDEANNG